MITYTHRDKTVPFPNIAAKIWFSSFASNRTRRCNYTQSQIMSSHTFWYKASRNTNTALLFPFIKPLVIFTDHSAILNVQVASFIRRAKFLMSSAAYFFMSLRERMWFMVRLLGVAARGSCYVLPLLPVVRRCCSLQLVVRSPRYAPTGGMPFIISLELSSEVPED